MEKELKIPQADKLVGTAEELKHGPDRLEEKMKEIYMTQGVKKIEGYEIDKGEKELAIIKFVNESVAKYLKKYGRNIKMETPLDKIHILEDGGTEKYTMGRFSGGGHSTLSGSTVVDRKKIKY